MNEPRVTCECCAGTGKRALTYTESVTLAEVPRIAWSATGAIRERLGGDVNSTALCNRLATLRDLGLIESRESRTNHRIKEHRRLR